MRIIKKKKKFFWLALTNVAKTLDIYFRFNFWLKEHYYFDNIYKLKTKIKWKYINYILFKMQFLY